MHWQHPQFCAYYPTGFSYPSLLGEILSNGLSSVGMSWASSPAIAELDDVVLNWVGEF